MELAGDAALEILLGASPGSIARRQISQRLKSTIRLVKDDNFTRADIRAQLVGALAFVFGGAVHEGVAG